MQAGLGGLPQGTRKPLPMTVPMMQIRINADARGAAEDGGANANTTPQQAPHADAGDASRADDCARVPTTHAHGRAVRRGASIAQSSSTDRRARGSTSKSRAGARWQERHR